MKWDSSLDGVKLQYFMLLQGTQNNKIAPSPGYYGYGNRTEKHYRVKNVQ